MISVNFALRIQNTLAKNNFRTQKGLRTSVIWSCIQAVLLGQAVLLSISAHAESTESHLTVEASKLEIVASALGIRQVTQYSPNRNAMGVAWAKHFGMEASYFNAGESKFAKRNSASSDDVGGRVNLKLALDLSTPLSERSRVYSRVGMYVWDVDVNYNRATNRLDASRESKSGMVGIGAIYGEDSLLMGIELEQVSAVSFDDPRDQQRVLFNIVSKF